MVEKKKTKNGRKTRRPTKKEIERQKAIRRLVVALVVTLLLFFAIFKLGAFGIFTYNLVRFFVGSLAYPVMFLIIFFLFSGKWIRKQSHFVSGVVMMSVGLLLLFHTYLFSFIFRDGQAPLTATRYLVVSELLNQSTSQFLGGGMIGALIYSPIAFLFTNIGSYIFSLVFIGWAIFLLGPWTVDDLLTEVTNLWNTFLAKVEIKKQERFVAKEERRKQREEEAEQARLEELVVDEETGEILEDKAVSSSEAPVPTPEPVPVSEPPKEPEIIAYDNEVTENASPLVSDDTYFPEDYYDEMAMAYDDEEPIYQPMVEEEYSLDDLMDDAPLHTQEAPTVKVKPYHLPTIDLFAPDQPKNQNKEKKLVRENIRVLEDTFKSFGINATVERAEIGPSVTKYEVKPAVGVRVNRISNLSDDLALALAAKDVRIEAPIPGKSLVGIEVPNSEIATVTFRELWEQSNTDPDKLLEVPLGKAVNGKARSFDLAKMPHLLVAGSTGSGKSVAVNGIISSILMKARPDQVKFMMIDPKMVELSVYNDIPHLLIPVVTNPRKASKALQKVVNEMEERYELFSKVGVRNIAGYNAKVEEHNVNSGTKDIPMPLLVVIVDELADLMMVASKEVEDAIIRLGQKARAAGIHMILATQRPSVDVISGLIKANVPSRIAFAVSSGTDSRTILDENGAEKLLGRGDMLFKPIDENHPVRLQGSFISDDDVERIVSYIKEQAEADYDESFDPGEVPENDSGGGASSDGDPLFEQAKALVLETQKASASMLQRRLQVGFNRATRLMEELEANGVIGPAEGTKPRKVLMVKPTES